MNNETKNFKTLSTENFDELIKNNEVTIIDIRDQDSFNNAHIPGAISLNNDNVDEFINSTPKHETLLFYCYHGVSSQGAAQHFCNLGFKNVYSLDGGYTQYSKDNI